MSTPPGALAHPLAESRVESLLELVRHTTGIAPHAAIRSGVERALRRALAAGQSAEALAARALEGDPTARRVILESARVGETYFLRHREQLEEVASALPPEGGAVWCAGCSTGEEAYSVAILAAEAGRRPRILATDVSEQAVGSTRAATYGAWAVRKVTARRLSQYFVPVSRDGWAVAPPLRDTVSVLAHNLLDAPVDPGPFDVILCRNVLIYFHHDTAAQVLRRLAGVLRPGGVLMVAPSELGLAPRELFVPARMGRALVLRRSEEVATAGGYLPARRAAPAPRPVVPREAPPVRARRPAIRPHDGATSHTLPPRVEPPRAAVLPAPAQPGPRAGQGTAAEAGPPPAVDWDTATPEAFVRAAHAANASGDLDGAFEHLRRALFLGPDLPIVHALISALHRRSGRATDAARERDNALALLQRLPDDALLAAADGLTAGALRSALLSSSREPSPLERHADR